MKCSPEDNFSGIAIPKTFCRPFRFPATALGLVDNDKTFLEVLANKNGIWRRVVPLSGGIIMWRRSYSPLN